MMNRKIPLPSSFRDPSGFLFRENGLLYRQVNHSYAKDYDHLMESGLNDVLVKGGFFISHEDVSNDLELKPPAYKILRPEAVHFISYPYEWCFSQLKDAALTTLQIQEIALDYGMSLKDSSAYNIQFHQGKPVLIDTLSFEIYREGEPWDAYRQFCQHFLAPLSLMSYTDERLSKLLRVYIDGIPLDLASSLLPARTRFNFPILSHIHLHAAAQKRYSDKPIKPEEIRVGKMSRVGFLGLISSLKKITEKLEWKPEGTEWGDYYAICNYPEESVEEKKAIISRWMDAVAPSSVWDLGANVGFFSRIFSDKGIPTIAYDIDPAAVELNYLETLERKEKSLLPLVLDLTNPSPNLGWANAERTSFLERGPSDLVLALALIHHIVISNNVPLLDFASFLARLGSWVIVEFVPKEDSQVQKLLATRKDIFEDYDRKHFESSMAGEFHIEAVKEIEGTQRLLYLLKKREGSPG
jgi:hypothetical protein